MGVFDSIRNALTSEKASRVTTPPLARQKPKYGDKKMVKAVKPKKKGK
jgi:hypothetical protein